MLCCAWCVCQLPRAGVDCKRFPVVRPPKGDYTSTYAAAFCRQVRRSLIGASSQSCWGGSKLLFRRAEARRLKDRQGRVLVEGKPSSPLPPARGLEERYKVPQQGQERSPVAKTFTCIPDAPDGLSWNLLRPSLGACPPPLNLPMTSVFIDRIRRIDTAYCWRCRTIRGRSVCVSVKKFEDAY